MKKWNTPALAELNINETANGNAAHDYECDLNFKPHNGDHTHSDGRDYHKNSNVKAPSAN